MFNNRTKGWLLGTILFSCTVVSGGPLVIDTAVVQYSTTGTTTVSGGFQQFDPALGTLLQITFYAFNGSQSLAMEVSNQGPGDVTETANFSVSSRINLPNGVLGLSLFDLSSGNTCSSLGHEFGTCDQTAVASQNGQTNTSLVNPFPDNSPYIGVGTVPFTVNLITNIQVTTDSPAGGLANIISDSSSGSVYLGYTYDPVVSQTPEPGTLGILGGGLGLLVFLRQRKDKRGRAVKRSASGA